MNSTRSTSVGRYLEHVASLAVLLAIHEEALVHDAVGVDVQPLAVGTVFLPPAWRKLLALGIRGWAGSYYRRYSCHANMLTLLLAQDAAHSQQSRAKAE